MRVSHDETRIGCNAAEFELISPQHDLFHFPIASG